MDYFLDNIADAQVNGLFGYCCLSILGLIVGSFLNMVIYRLPLMIKQRLNANNSPILEITTNICPVVAYNINLFIPRSHCRFCRQTIAWWSNIPVISFILLRGKCIKCKQKFSISYPLIEILTAALYLLTALYIHSLWVLLAYLVLISMLICLMVIDYLELLLPDELTLSLLWIGLLVNLNGSISSGLANSVIGAVVGYLCLWALYWSIKLITKIDGMGYGDFKLLAAILAWFGYEYLLPVLLIAPCLGILYYLGGRMLGKIARNEPIPFGLFLGLSAILLIFLKQYPVWWLYN